MYIFVPQEIFVQVPTSAEAVGRQLRRWGTQYRQMVRERPQDRHPQMDRLLARLEEVFRRDGWGLIGAAIFTKMTTCHVIC